MAKIAQSGVGGGKIPKLTIKKPAAQTQQASAPAASQNTAPVASLPNLGGSRLSNLAAQHSADIGVPDLSVAKPNLVEQAQAGRNAAIAQSQQANKPAASTPAVAQPRISSAPDWWQDRPATIVPGIPTPTWNRMTEDERWAARNDYLASREQVTALQERAARQAEMMQGTEGKTNLDLYLRASNRYGTADQNGKGDGHWNATLAQTAQNINNMYIHTVAPAYKTYEQAMKDYEAGTGTYDAALKAYNEYMAVYYQYAPMQQAYEAIRATGGLGVSGDNSLDVINQATELWDATLAASEKNIEQLEKELNEAEQKYLDAATSMGKLSTPKQRQEVEDLYMQFVQKSGEYNAAMFVYGEMAGNFTDLDEMARTALYREYPELTWAENVTREDSDGNLHFTESSQDLVNRIEDLQNRAYNTTDEKEREKLTQEANWYLYAMQIPSMYDEFSADEIQASIDYLEQQILSLQQGTTPDYGLPTTEDELDAFLLANGYSRSAIDAAIRQGYTREQLARGVRAEQMEAEGKDPYSLTGELPQDKYDEYVTQLSIIRNALSRMKRGKVYQEALGQLSTETRDRMDAFVAAGVETGMDLTDLILSPDSASTAATRLLLRDKNPELLTEIEGLRQDFKDAGFSDKEAEGLLLYAAREINDERVSQLMSSINARAEQKSEVFNFLSTVGNSFVSGSGHMVDLLRFTGILPGGRDAFTGEFYIDPNASEHDPYHTMQANEANRQARVNSIVMDIFGEKEFGKKMAEMANKFYGLSISMGQSNAIRGLTMLGLPCATLLLGASAGEARTMEMLDRGYSDGAALVAGVIAATGETLSEKVSLDHFMKGVRSAGKGLSMGQWLWQALIGRTAQGGVEASEEVGSDVFQFLGDYLVVRWLNGGVSEIDQRANEIRLAARAEDPPRNIDWAEAQNLAWKDWVKGVGNDAIGGLMSGLLMGDGQVLGAIQNVHSDVRAGKAVLGLDQWLANRGFEPRMVAELQRVVDSIDAPTAMSAHMTGADLKNAYQIGHAMQNLPDAYLADAINSRLQYLGETNVTPALVSAIDAASHGYRLSAVERIALRDSRFGQQVVEELQSVWNDEADPNSAWATDALAAGQAEKEFFTHVPDLFDTKKRVDAAYSQVNDGLRTSNVEDPATTISTILNSGFARDAEIYAIIDDPALRAEFEKQTGEKLTGSRKHMKDIARKYLLTSKATLEQIQAQRTQNANPGATVMGPAASALAEAGMADANRALVQGELLDAIANGKELSPFDMRKLNLADPAVRRVFIRLTGMSNLPTVISSELKEALVNQAVDSVRKIQETQEAIGESAEQLFEAQQEQASAQLDETVRRVMEEQPKKRTTKKTSRAQNREAYLRDMSRAYEQRLASGGRRRRIEVSDRTEQDVVRQIKQQSGVSSIQSKSAFEQSYRTYMGIAPNATLTKEQRIGLDAGYDRYLMGLNLTAQERDALNEVWWRGQRRAERRGARVVSEERHPYDERLIPPSNVEGTVTFDSSVDLEALKKEGGIRWASVQVLRRLAKSLGVNFRIYATTEQDGERVWIDGDGKRHSDNGMYDPTTNEILIDLNAGGGGQGTMLFTTAHELVHWMRDFHAKSYDALANYLLDMYADNGNDVHELQQAIIDKYAKKGITLTMDGTALEELVARSMEAMLTDGNVLQNLEGLRDADRGAFNKVVQYIQNLVDKIKDLYKSFKPDTAEARYVQEMGNAFLDLQQLFTEGLINASKSYKVNSVLANSAKPLTEAPVEGEVIDTPDGEMYSIRSMKHDIAEGKMFEDLEASGMSHEDVMDLKNGLTDLVDFMSHAQFGTMTDEQWRRIIDMNEEYERDNRPFKPYKPNSDPLYTVSLDFSTLCRKRLLTQYVIEHLQTELQNGVNGKTGRPLTAEEQLAVRDSLKEYRDQGRALQVACAMCYVEAARLKSPKVIQQFLADPEAAMIRYYSLQNADFRKAVEQMKQEWKVQHGLGAKATKAEIKKKLGQKGLNQFQREVDAMRDNYGNTEYISEEERKTIETAKSLPNTVFLTAANLAALAENEETKDIYAAFTTKVRAATRSKSLEADVPYYYGDSVYDPETDKGLSDTLIANLRRENGLRFSSWSDYQIQHMLDMMTAIIELSTRGASMHGYTKFLDQVRVFGKTGMMFNLSGVAEGMGLDENGELIFSPSESVLVKSEDGTYDGLEARDEFPDTVGIQCIGVSYEHILALLDADYIDYIIPYHTSGLNATLRKMAGIFGWKDFTFAQEERPIPGAKWDPARCAEEDWQRRPSFSEWFTRDGKDGLDAMRKSAENYKKLCADRGLYPKFSSGNKSVNADFTSHPNYWKLLIDRKMINQKTGKLIEQKAVKPIFEFDRIKNEVKDYVANYDPEMEQKALDWVRNQLFNPDDPGALERRIAKMKAAEKAKKDKKNKTPQQKLEELNVLDFATTAAVTKEALEDGTMKSIRDQHMEAFDAAVRATVDKAVSTGRWSSRNEITELYAKDPEAFIILELYKGGQAEKTARARFEAYLDTVDDLEFLSNLSWYPVKTIPTDSRKKIAGAIRKYQNMIKKRELAIKEAQVGGQNVGVEQREYSLQEVRELFNDLNQDKDVAELADKVFATAEKLGTRVYFTRSLKTKTGYTPKAYGISYGQTVQIRQDFMNGAQHSDQKKASAILHEIIHSCTTYVMKYKDLERLYSYGVSKELLDAADTLRSIYRQVYASGAGKHYGLTNEDEFLAELSNPDFREYLKQKNLWDRVVDAIKKIFGLDTENALEGAQAALEYILEHPDFGGAVDYNAIAIQYEGGAPQMLEASAEDNRYMHSLRSVDPVQPTSTSWFRTKTFDEVKRDHPTLFALDTDDLDVRNPTQIRSTVSTYRKVYDILKREGFKGNILDASSGLGYGTKAGIEEYGFNVDDIEPYPDKSYKPKYTDYSTLNNQYDVIISNAVLNVLPQDIRDALTVKMGDLLAPGGRLFVNVRGNDVDTLDNGKNTKLGPREWFVESTGSYQKGFTKPELVAYLQDALGSGFAVTPTSQFGGVAAVVTRTGDTMRSVRYRAQDIKMGLNFNDPNGALLDRVFSGEKQYETRLYTDAQGNGRLPRAYLNKPMGIIQTGAGKAKLVGFWELGDGELRDYDWLSKPENRKALGNDGTAFEAKPGEKRWVYPIKWVEQITPAEVDTRAIRARDISAITSQMTDVKFSARDLDERNLTPAQAEQAAEAAAEAERVLDEMIGKGQAKKLKQTVRRLENRAVKAEQKAEIQKEKAGMARLEARAARQAEKEAKREANKTIRNLTRDNKQAIKEKQALQKKLDTQIERDKKKLAAIQSALDAKKQQMREQGIANTAEKNEMRREFAHTISVNARTDKQWANKLYQSAVRNERKDARRRQREALEQQEASFTGKGRAARRVINSYRSRPAPETSIHAEDEPLPNLFPEKPLLPEFTVDGLFRQAIEKTKAGADKFLRTFENYAQEIDRMARDQGRPDNLSVKVSAVRAAKAVPARIWDFGLIVPGGNAEGPAMKDVLLCLDEKGKIDAQMQNDLNSFMIWQLTADRMSVVQRAEQRKEAWVEQHDWLRDVNESELVERVLAGDKVATRYLILLKAAAEARNKAVVGWADEFDSPVTAEEAQRYVDEVKATKPELVKKANAIYDYWDAIMRTYAVGTLISEEQYDIMREIYPHYIPAFREMDEGGDKPITAMMNNDSLVAAPATKAAKGSTRKLLRLEDQYVKALQQVVRAYYENDFLTQLIGEFMFDMDGNYEKYGFFDWDSVNRGIRDYVFSFLGMQHETNIERVKDGMYKITCYVNGEKMSAYVSRPIFEGLQGLFNKTTLFGSTSLYKKAVRLGGKILNPAKSMITGVNPFFAGRNLARDTQTALINSVAGPNFLHYQRVAAAKILRQDHDWITFQNLGGVASTKVYNESGFAPRLDRRLAVLHTKTKAGEGLVRAKNAVGSVTGTVADAAAALGEFSESISRFAEYLATLDMLGGDSYINRQIAIRNAAEVTVDFGRRGTMGSLINNWVMYWNPGMQGLSKAFRIVFSQPTVRKKIKAFGHRAFMVSILPAAIQTLIIGGLGEWEEYEKLSDRIKDQNFCIPLSWLGEKYKHKFLKIPRTQDWGVFISAPFMRMMEGRNGREKPFEHYLQTAIIPNMPVGTPLPVQWLLQYLTNKDSFGQTIVPYDLKDLSAKLQFDADTSWLAKTIGEAINMSPMQIDQFLEDYMGNFWGPVLRLIPGSPFSPIGYRTGETTVGENVKDAWQTVKSPFIADNRYSSSIRSGYYDLYKRLQQEYKDTGSHGGDPEKDMEDFEFYKALSMSNGYAQQISALTKRARDLPPGEEKDLYYDEITGLCDEALQFYRAWQNGEVKDATHWMVYHRYGDLIMNELYALREYDADYLHSKDGEYNFSGSLGSPDTVWDKSGENPVKYVFDKDQDLHDIYDGLRAEQYQKIITEIITSDQYKDPKATKEFKAQLLEDGKTRALKEAEKMMVQYLRDAGFQGEEIVRPNHDYVETQAAYSLAQILGDDSAYDQRITDELIRLYDWNDEYDFAPTSSKKETFTSTTDPSQVYILTDKQSEKYSEIYHDTLTKFYNKVMDSERYQAATEEVQALMLDMAKTYAGQQTAATFNQYLINSGATSEDKYQIDDVIKQDARYEIQRALGFDNSYPMELTDELVRLWDYKGDFNFMPSDVNKKYFTSPTDDSVRYVLSDDQSQKYAELYRASYTDYLLQVQSERGYDSLSGDEKARRLEYAKTYAAEKANEDFGAWIVRQRDAVTEQVGKDEIADWDAKWDVQRILGFDNTIPEDVAGQLLNPSLYELKDEGTQNYLPQFSPPTTYVYVDEKGKKWKDYKWIITPEQREVYTAIAFDIYVANMTEVMNSSTYRQLDDYGKAFLLSAARAQTTDDTRLAFQQWLRDNDVQPVYMKTDEEIERQTNIGYAEDITSGILGR